MAYRAIRYDFLILKRVFGRQHNIYIDSLRNLSNKYAHRFPKHSADLKHVTIDPFRNILKRMRSR